jgi:hypothetical protein
VFKERAGCAGGGKGILITENKSFTLSTLLDEAICFEKPSNPIILNDQGVSVMDVSYEKTATLRAQDHGHPPVICLQGGGETSQNSQGCGFSEGGGLIHSEHD